MNKTLSPRIHNLIYGPVSSWRLGRSLGVDVVSQSEKTCSFDCAYCQLGPTRCLTAERREFVPLARLEVELSALPEVQLDHVTFSGRGEPTLASNLGEAIAAAKRRFSVPVAVLTNSSLITDGAVRRDLSEADRVVAKLDAPTQRSLLDINRPAPGIALDGILDALCVFRDGYSGHLALQMMFYEANRLCAEELAALARRIKPDAVEINTPLRPCPVEPLSVQAVAGIVKSFSGLPAHSVYGACRPDVQPLDVTETAKRRPVI